MARFCVILVCNEGYLDKAGFVAQQLLAQTNRNFDVLICTDEIPDPKPSFLPQGVSLRQIDLDDTLKNLPQNERLKHYTYWRLPAIEMLSTEYERILYLDTDVFVAGEGLSALFDVDMQGATLAATLVISLSSASISWNRCRLSIASWTSLPKSLPAPRPPATSNFFTACCKQGSVTLNIISTR